MVKYVSFRIQNFKGIKDTTVSFEALVGANVFAFVGLNESGKTTVLEAIHSFAPDEATSELLGGKEGLGVPFKERVPRHQLSEFTGEVSVTATLQVARSEVKEIAAELLSLHSIQIDPDEFPETISFERSQLFENGDLKASYLTPKWKFSIRTDKQRKWRTPESAESRKVRDAVFKFVPRIAYFPTFVFEFPKSIFLTNRGTVVDKFYRSVFQDILDFDGRGQTIEKDIVRRVRRDEMVVPWVQFLPAWGIHDDRDKIQQVVDRAGAAVTKLVFGRWNKIFGEDTRGKEVSITYQIIEGEVEDPKGVKSKTLEHDVLISFQIKDGTRRYDVNDRSLGFRWFFSFMLFTQFRVARSGKSSSSLLFLFDEPASNLHAAAQQKLIESFPEIAVDGNILAYSTHSHYMIEPKWLEQTFIVTNRSDVPADSMMDEVSLDDESLDVKVESYRSFVNRNPSKTSYFQPILDRLDVLPSKFDMQKASIVLEGRSDYYIIRYAQQMLGSKELSLIPGLGAGTFGALAALHIGWNLNFLFVLDGDGKGKKEREAYRKEFGIPLERLVLLPELVPELSVIEDLLDDGAIERISVALGISSNPSKGQIKRFFQERLATGDATDIGPVFRSRSANLLQALQLRLAK